MIARRDERIVAHDPQDLARQAAHWLLEKVNAAPSDKIAVSLAGGSTPAATYSLLAEAPFRDKFPWSRVHWFWGDERHVPPDSPRSNYRMVREKLLDRASVPAGNIHPMLGDGDPAQVAAQYDRELRRFYGADNLSPERPLFAATLLGLGEDGHTASLFPGMPVLKVTDALAAPVIGYTLVPEARISLTYPALNSSAALAFLVSGKAKQPMVQKIVRGGDFPAAHIRPVGTLTWLMDRDAAA